LTDTSPKLVIESTGRKIKISTVSGSAHRAPEVEQVNIELEDLEKLLVILKLIRELAILE